MSGHVYRHKPICEDLRAAPAFDYSSRLTNTTMDDRRAYEMDREIQFRENFPGLFKIAEGTKKDRCPVAVAAINAMLG